ncbi:hypothetical protein DIPPA_06605 [Diplonema papillatum]|nr:hypothetical protein DIPPA_06605 [Diplonema papillatum]
MSEMKYRGPAETKVVPKVAPEAADNGHAKKQQKKRSRLGSASRWVGAFVLLLVCSTVAVNPLKVLVELVDYISWLNENKVVTNACLVGQNVKLFRDPESGVVQVVAENEHDLLFGQGYAHGMDRLFQLEIFRRLSRGEMAEVVGAKALQLDKWHRAMGYTHLAQSDWDFLRTDPKSKEVKEGLLAYIKGLNAYLEERSLMFNLPVDLLLLRDRPKKFSPEDVLGFLRWHSSSMNKGWQNELVFAELYATFDDEIINAIRGGVAYASNNTGGGMHATLYNAHEVRRFPSKKGQSGDGNKWSRHDPPHVSEMTAGVSENGGSNAWVISGNFTENGRPIVANDPHLPFTLPSAWHGMRLTSKELGVDHIGLSVPLIPYIIAGVNGDISNGVTLGRCDVDDIFIEKISEEDNNTIDRKYLDSDGATKPVRTRIEMIKVKGQKLPVEFVVEETRRGPLICGLLGIDEVDCSLASLAIQKTDVLVNDLDRTSIVSMRGLMFAKDFDSFRSAVKQMGICNLNMVFADNRGNIGYQMTGRVPKRKDVGETPREGWNPAHQWQGWYPFESMPHTLNPESGYVVSANQKPYFDGKEPPEYLGHVWQHGWRGRRIEELIQASINETKGKLSVSHSKQWQRDIVSIPGRQFALFLKSHYPFTKMAGANSKCMCGGGQCTEGCTCKCGEGNCAESCTCGCKEGDQDATCKCGDESCSDGCTCECKETASNTGKADTKVCTKAGCTSGQEDVQRSTDEDTSSAKEEKPRSVRTAHTVPPVQPGPKGFYKRVLDRVLAPGKKLLAAGVKRFASKKNYNYTTEVNEMVTLMTQWNGTMATDLAQPAIFASVKEQFLRTVLSSSINSTRTVDAILGVGFVSGGKMSNDLEGRHSVFFLRLLENHPVVRPLLRRMNQTIEETLYDALVTTYDVFSRATKKKSPSAWRWGQVHTASFSHPLGKAGFPMNLVFNVESGGIPGDVDTVSLGAYLHEKEPVPGLPLPRPLYQQRGFAASSRWVVSFQEDKPADAHIIIAPGNSGRLSSKHYDDKKHILTAPVESGIDHLTRDSFDTEKELEIEIRAGECKAP